MEKPNNFILREIRKEDSHQYILVFDLNGERQEIIARISMETPIFGVNFSDELTLIKHKSPKEMQQIIKILKYYHFDSQDDSPLIFDSKLNTIELKAA